MREQARDEANMVLLKHLMLRLLDGVAQRCAPITKEHHRRVQNKDSSNKLQMWSIRTYPIERQGC